MNIYNHLGMWLTCITICNIIELVKKDPFYNKSCPNWWIPSASGMLVAIGIELIILIKYLLTYGH